MVNGLLEHWRGWIQQQEGTGATRVYRTSIQTCRRRSDRGGTNQKWRTNHEKFNGREVN